MQPSISEHATHTAKSTTQVGWVTLQHMFAVIEKITALHWETTKAVLDEAQAHDTASTHPMTTSLHLNRVAIDKLTHYGARACAIAGHLQTSYQEALRSHMETLSQQWHALTACTMSVRPAMQTVSAAGDMPKATSSTNKPAA
ncbi:hypothetical protein WT83_16630 [Burkholderia territorii]|uniref:Phasin family protein n=1 Tax=Burkholderia territorii TaxID=1503055 RepID=A0A108EP77_9BURK|nr:hypothetical protein [Burkholderia territorii]KWN14712.1 hypothetical protein WT83_16630 [Burkholderia territorii]